LRREITTPLGEPSYRYRNYLPAKAMSEGLGNLQTFKAPAPEFLLAQVLRPASALGVVAVAMPGIDGVESASEAAIGDSNLDDEQRLALSHASRCFLHSHWTGHG
jgi:hypothetical protein